MDWEMRASSMQRTRGTHGGLADRTDADENDLKGWRSKKGQVRAEIEDEDSGSWSKHLELLMRISRGGWKKKNGMEVKSERRRLGKMVCACPRWPFWSIACMYLPQGNECFFLIASVQRGECNNDPKIMVLILLHAWSKSVA